MLTFEFNLAPEGPPQKTDQYQQQNGEECSLGDQHDDPPTIVSEHRLPDFRTRPDGQAAERLGQGDARRPLLAGGDNYPPPNILNNSSPVRFSV